MNESHSRFTGSIPEIYDAHLGPLLFEFSARDLAERTKNRIPRESRVLEVACGTGISTEYLRNALFETVAILATDLNEAMLEVARKKRSHLSGVSFEFADALSLPHEDRHFDAVFCQFGVMFFPDKPKGVGEMVRVLKPGGILGFNVWDSLEMNPPVAVAHETISRYFDSDPPQFLKTPFGFHDVKHIQHMLTKAGLCNIECHVVSEVITGLEATRVAKGFVEGNPGIIEIKQRARADAHELTRAVARALEDAFGPAPLKFPLQEIVFIATKPV
jgi:ubiquinone/menaquinone biosynthesis C-methylase UbiE